MMMISDNNHHDVVFEESERREKKKTCLASKEDAVGWDIASQAYVELRKLRCGQDALIL